MKLEELTKGSTVKGILPNQVVMVVDVKWFCSDVIEQSLPRSYAIAYLGRYKD